MKDYFGTNLKKSMSLYECFANNTTMLHPYDQVMKMDFSQCICNYNTPTFLPITKELFDKLASFGINKYEDFINYPVSKLKTNFSTEEITCLFARALPILDNFLEDDELRKCAAISTCYMLKQIAIGALLFDLYIEKKEPKALSSKIVDKDCMLFLYSQLYYFLNPKQSMITSDYRLVFMWLYESLDSKAQKELADYKKLYDLFNSKQVIYPEIITENFVISQGDIANFADYLKEGRTRLAELKKEEKSNYMVLEEINKQYNREVSFINSLFVNKILSESDIKTILGAKDSRKIIAFQNMKANL